MMQAECGRIAARPVVIAAHHNAAKFPRQFNHFIRVCAIADNVAEVPDRVIWWRCRKHRFESRQIGMDVGDDEGAHVSFTFVLWLFFHLWEAAAMRLPCAILHLGPERSP